VYVRVIGEWALSVEGPLTATGYTGFRVATNPAWPSQNTLAKAFGSWADALRAAGLGDRVALEYPNGWSAWAKPSPAARARDQGIVVAAVRALEAKLERSPNATEYFAWRLNGRRELPSQAKTYRLFPGGWTRVLEAAGLGRDA
jgi:hypothetical protein